MQEKVLLLESSIRRDLQVIASIYEALDRRPLSPASTEDELIVIAYHLHNLYNAFENIFLGVAATFEHSLADAERWHAQLLERMRLDVMPLRPALIDDLAHDALDELRRFRYLFRHAYTIGLDAARLQLVLQRALVLRDRCPTMFEPFMAFLRSLA